jgi:hypothetical protein
LDEAADRLSAENRDSQAALQAKLQEGQAEQQRLLAVERQAAHALVADTGKHHDERLREALSNAERERARAESAWQRQLEDVRRSLQRELAEAMQRHETANASSLEHEVGELQQGLEEARRTSASAIQSVLEQLDRRTREAAESLARIGMEQSEQQRAGDEELRNIMQMRTQCLEDRLGELRDQYVCVEKDLKQTADELPSLARRLNGALQAQSAAHEELKRKSEEKHSKTIRKATDDGEALLALTQQVTASQEDWRRKQKDMETGFHAGITALRKEGQTDVSALRDEIVAAQKALQTAHAELAPAHRSRK